MKRGSIKLLTFITILLTQSTSFAFEMDSGIEIGSIFAPSDSPISVGFQGEGMPSSLDPAQAENELREILNTWNAVSCSSINLVLAEENTKPDVPIYWGDNRTNTCIPNDTDIGFTYFSPCINGDFRYERNSILLNSNPRYDWRHEADPYQNADEEHVVDLSSVLTHEIGHALGLQHSDVPLSTMFAKYLLDGGMRTLSADDKYKLCLIYPEQKNECGADSDCGDGTCVAKDNWNICEERRADNGEFCALDELVCKTCLLTSKETFSGYCTSSCDENLPCEEGLVCADDGFCRIEASGDPTESGCSTTSDFSFISFAFFSLILLGSRKKRKKSISF